MICAQGDVKWGLGVWRIRAVVGIKAAVGRLSVFISKPVSDPQKMVRNDLWIRVREDLLVIPSPFVPNNWELFHFNLAKVQTEQL